MEMSPNDVKQWIARAAGMYADESVNEMPYSQLLYFLFKDNASRQICGHRIAGMLAELIDSGTFEKPPTKEGKS